MGSKNNGKKSLITRFKPIICIDHSFPFPMRKRDPVLSYLTLANKDGAVLPAVLSSISRVAGKFRRKTAGDKWPDLKAALYETTLMRMVIRRKKANKNKLSLSRSISNLEEKSSDKISKPKYKSICRTCSNVSSTFPTSSLSSTISPVNTLLNRSNNKTLPPYVPLNGYYVTKQKQTGVEDRNKGNSNNNYGSNAALCCMLSITLLILVLWGKFVAILFTSLCLYLVPRKPCKEGGLCGESKNKLVQNKVVFMEGVAENERNHCSKGLVPYMH